LTQRFLTEATEALASSLDYEQTLQKVADLAVPHIADWCGVDMVEEDGSLRLLAVAHIDPEKVQWAYEQRRLYPPDLNAAHGLPNVLRTGRSEIYPDIPDELLVATARDARHLELTRYLGLRSAMIVPILARERVLGIITFITTQESGQNYTDEALLLAEGLATRAALAIENARLYRAAQEELTERRRVQEALERSEARFRFALANSDISVYMQDRDLRYTWVYSGKTNEERTRIYGKTDDEFLEAVDAARLTEIKRRVLQTGVEERHIARATYRGQEPEYFDTVFAPLRDAEGTVVGVTGTVTDVTERKKAQDALVQHQAEIEALNVRLQRSMSETHHRVKNNLQVISALLDMQEMQHEDVVPISEIVRLRQHIKSLSAIHDLLTFQAKKDAEVYDLSVKEAIDKLVPMLQAMVAGRTIVVSVEDLRMPVRQSTTLTVLVNELVSNALKHGKGRIDLAFFTRNGNAVLEVRDEGPGFPESFDPVTGANTGLELVQTLARLDLQGETRFENRGGGGAWAVVEFPIPSKSRTTGER
jgi:two-component sensor histidine kinase/PAS domain-containing protein